MAGEQEIRPVDTQIGHVEHAPNYVNMYAESIKAALEPFNYLLNYQKELSEEDVRKADIQNLLFEHDYKTKALNEEIRAHGADEAGKTLERQLESKKLDEMVRHDQADESHSTAMEGLEKQRLTYEEDQKKAEQDYRDKDLELRKSESDAKISEAKQTQSEAALRTKIYQNELDDRTNNDKLAAEMSDWISSIKPEDLWNSAENPEIQKKLDYFLTNLKGPYGRDMYDHLIQSHIALGQEIADRKEISGFSTEGKRKFNSEMDRLAREQPNLTVQDRFNQALEAGRSATIMQGERGKWSPEALKAYQDYKIHNPNDEAGAFGAGRAAEEQYQKELKAKETGLTAPPKEMIAAWQGMVTLRQGETPDQRDVRANKFASDMGEAWGRHDEDAMAKLKATVNAAPGAQGAQGGDTSTWLKNRGYTVKKGLPQTNPATAPVIKPTSMVSPGQQQQQGATTLSPMDRQQLSPAYSLAMSTMPTSEPATDLSKQFDDYFGSESETA